MRAVVFSAGGSFGAYQAGVWRALEELDFRPQVVAGTSAGSLNAAAVARGARAAWIEQLWRDPSADVFRWNWPPRGLGLLSARRLERRLVEMLEQFPRLTPGMRLRVTLTELRSLAIRTFADERVTLPVLLGSCAIPGIFPPVRLDGRRYCDGGVFCRAPVAAAIEAGGADILVVDVLDPPPSRLAGALIDAGIRARAWLRGEAPQTAIPPPVRVRVISPREPLGRVRDILRWDPRLIDRWIETGYRDALAALDFSPAALATASAAHASSPSAVSAAPR